MPSPGTPLGGVAALAAVIVLLLTLPSVGAAPTAPTPSQWTAPLPTSHAVSPPRSVANQNPASALAPAGSTTPVSLMGTRALAAARAEGVPSKFVFLPGAPASPGERARAAANGHISPGLCANCTGPMGIADYGLRNGTNGTVEPYVLNTTSLEGGLSVLGPGIEPLYVLDSSPDAYSVQLNGVLSDVTVANASYQFWTQNVVEYYAQSHVLFLVSNVWNFSSLLFPNSTIAAHGPLGVLVDDLFYKASVMLTNVTYPFNVTLYLNSTVSAGNDNVSFTTVLADGNGTHTYPYDYLTFKSSASGGVVSVPANFSADGFAYGPEGHPNDFELVVGGPGGGSQVNLYQVNATAALRYWNATAAQYEAVPSAIDFGGDSGESASGVNVEWTSGTAGPFALLSSGPSTLGGLWNASGSPGVATIQLGPTPDDAFVFFQPGAAGPFGVSEPEWAPTMLTDTIYLAPGSYSASALLAGYAPANGSLVEYAAGGVYGFSPTLAPDLAAGVTTPVWAWSNAQYPALSSGGLGTPASPYLINDQQTAPMSSQFGILNDFNFPVFTGVFLVRTNVSVELNDPGPFAAHIPSGDSGLPPVNDLSYTFYDASNVSLLGARNISGWFADDLYAGAPYLATFNVVLWNSTHDLIARNTFNSQSSAIYLYGGGRNTIWNNTIRWGSPPAGGTTPLYPEAGSVGIQEAENGDLVYDNAVYTPVTATTPVVDLYTGLARTYLDTWNVSNSSLSVVRYAAGFPNIPLYGSIVNTTYQGGNFWWDYGQPDNPLGRLPYDAAGGITHGGDYVPLVPTFTLAFQVVAGHPTNATWGVVLTPVGRAVQSASTGSNRLVFPVYPGQFLYTVTPPAGMLSLPPAGELNLSSSRVVNLTFRPINGTLVGRILPASAGIYLDGAPVATEEGAFQESLVPGSYFVNASARHYVPYSTTVAIVSAQVTYLNVTLAPFNGTLLGLVQPAFANVTVGGSPVTVNASGGFNLSLAPTVYEVVASAAGYADAYRNVTVSSNKTVNVTLTLTPLPAGAHPLPTIDWELLGIGVAAAVLVLLVVLVRYQRPPSPEPSPTPSGGSPETPPPAHGPPVPPGAGGP